tara:strand:+ start:120 stop:371 length:252 start_codon:yes stop_codon:yes gene_type:complete
MDIIDSKYIGLVSSRLKSLKESNQIYIISVVLSVATLRNIRIKQEDISTSTKQILILNATTVVHLPLSIILLKELTQHFINSM